MESLPTLQFIEVDNLATVEHDREVLSFPENRCTEYSWAECRDNMKDFYLTTTGQFVSWYSTPKGEPVFARMQNDAGEEFTNVSDIEVYYRSRVLDPALIKARRQVLDARNKVEKPITEPKISKHVEFAKEVYNFVNTRRNQVEKVKMNASESKNIETNVRFNIFDDVCMVYGLGNIGIFLNKAKILYAPVEKPVVKLQTLKTRLEDAVAHHRTLGYEIAIREKSLQQYNTDLMEAESISLNDDNMFSQEDIAEIEEIISSLTERISKVQLELTRMKREFDLLADKIPLMQHDIENWNPVSVKKNGPVSSDLAFVWRLIKFLNKWDYETFSFFEALHEHANSFKPKDETTEYMEELKSKNIVLNVRTQPAAKRQAPNPAPAVAPTAAPAVAPAAAPTTAPTRPQRQAPPTQARPAQSRLARLGLAGKRQ